MVTLSWTVTPRVALHEPVVLTISIVNQSSQDVSLDMGYDRIGRFALDMTNPDGRRQTVRPRMNRSGATASPTFVLQPSGSAEPKEGYGSRMPTPYVDQVILDDWLSFAEVGHYSVGIAFDGTVRPAPGVAVDVARERAFDVTVTPRSERALQEYCQEQLVAARDTHARWLALQLLSHVVDPAAVPFLERAVTQFQALALTQTMVEVGTTQARQALQRLTSDPDETVRQAATAALTRMGR